LLLGSLVAHVAALVLTAHFLTQPGVEAATDAVSVEIVVDATPNPNTDPSLAGEAAIKAETTKDKAQRAKLPEEKAVQPSSSTERKQEATEPPADTARQVRPETQMDTAAAIPPPVFSLPPTPPDVKAPPPKESPATSLTTAVPAPTFSLPRTPPAIDAPAVLATPQLSEIHVPQSPFALPAAPPKVEVENPMPMTLETMRKAVPTPALRLDGAPPRIADATEPSLALPDKAPPPRSAPVEAKPEPKSESPATAERTPAIERKREMASETRQKPTGRRVAETPKQDRRIGDRSSSAGVGKAVGQGSVASRGGASAGEKAAYAARLNSHVQRYERYPAEAQRNGIMGSARILITIDRGGRLISSRLAGSSGSAILDDAAKATASRASPYPAPPDGIGGRTLTFAATIRFRR
jgi:protein TonB